MILHSCPCRQAHHVHARREPARHGDIAILRHGHALDHRAGRAVDTDCGTGALRCRQLYAEGDSPAYLHRVGRDDKATAALRAAPPCSGLHRQRMDYHRTALALIPSLCRDGIAVRPGTGVSAIVKVKVLIRQLIRSHGVADVGRVALDDRQHKCHSGIAAVIGRDWQCVFARGEHVLEPVAGEL